jgi:hypothetical protein
MKIIEPKNEHEANTAVASGLNDRCSSAQPHRHRMDNETNHALASGLNYLYSSSQPPRMDNETSHAPEWLITVTVYSMNTVSLRPYTVEYGSYTCRILP